MNEMHGPLRPEWILVDLRCFNDYKFDYKNYDHGTTHS